MGSSAQNSSGVPLPETFSGAFSGTLLNLTWLCTKASRPSPEPCPWNLLHNLLGTVLNLGSAPKPPRTFSGTFSGTLLNLTWLCTKDLHPNLPWNPVELDLALHQSLPDLLRNLLRNPVEPDLASLPDLLSPEPCWT